MDGTAAPSGSDAQFFLRIRYYDQTVEGEVVRNGTTDPEPFSGWLDLLRLLEGPLPDTAVSESVNNGSTDSGTDARADSGHRPDNRDGGRAGKYDDRSEAGDRTSVPPGVAVIRVLADPE